MSDDNRGSEKVVEPTELQKLVDDLQEHRESMRPYEKVRLMLRAKELLTPIRILRGWG